MDKDLKPDQNPEKATTVSLEENSKEDAQELSVETGSVNAEDQQSGTEVAGIQASIDMPDDAAEDKVEDKSETEGVPDETTGFALGAGAEDEELSGLKQDSPLAEKDDAGPANEIDEQLPGGEEKELPADSKGQAEPDVQSATLSLQEQQTEAEPHTDTTDPGQLDESALETVTGVREENVPSEAMTGEAPEKELTVVAEDEGLEPPAGIAPVGTKEGTGAEEELPAVKAEKQKPAASKPKNEEHLEASYEDHEEEDVEEDEDEADEKEEINEKYDTYSREELLTLLEQAVDSGDIPSIKTKVALIKVAFLKLSKEESQKQLDAFLEEGGSEEEYEPQPDELKQRFNDIFEKYKKKKVEYNEQQELLKLRNLDHKNQILEELRVLVNSDESLKNTYDKFKELQNQWKEIGLVPASEVNNLWQNYHFLVEKFFDKVRISKELRDLDLKKNLDLKIELCEKAEELLLETSIVKSFKELQKYHEEWKEIGPVPVDKKDEIWERFKTATDRINERRRDHYNSLNDEREKNLMAKTALCDEVEKIETSELKTIRDWQVKTNEINELFKVWKSIGPAPKKMNDEIWERFKTSMNNFFAEKKEFFGAIKQEQLNNYNLKLDLCRQAEEIKDNNDWKRTTNELINLQKEWKKVGPVPRKQSDKIWARFRAACDEFFNRKEDYFANIEERENSNLNKKLELIEKIKNFNFTDKKEENLEILKGFQREWTDIGFVPFKEKEKIQNIFRETINEKLDQLNISTVEMRTADFANKVENLKESPDSNRVIRKEIGFVNGRIIKLREDINLWENNIGFLAQSKKADLLKKEFDKKIQKAKEELALFEAKLKYLQQARD